MAKAKVPKTHRFKAMEWLLITLAVITTSALGLVFFVVTSEHPDLLSTSGFPGALVTNRVFQVLVIVGSMGLVSGGMATRVSLGNERATLLLMWANALSFAGVVLTYMSLAGPGS